MALDIRGDLSQITLKGVQNELEKYATMWKVT